MSNPDKAQEISDNNKINSTERTTAQVSGECPKCGGGSIEYKGLEYADGNAAYYSACCAECGCEFKEWYELVFTESEEDDNG